LTKSKTGGEGKASGTHEEWLETYSLVGNVSRKDVILENLDVDGRII